MQTFNDAIELFSIDKKQKRQFYILMQSAFTGGISFASTIMNENDSEKLAQIVSSKEFDFIFKKWMECISANQMIDFILKTC